MINIQNESLIPFREVPGWCAQHLGNRVHPSTVHRWRLRGVRGVKLETILAGGIRYCSAESLIHFFEEITRAADGEKSVAGHNNQVNFNGRINRIKNDRAVDEEYSFMLYLHKHT